jgi:hypothetical protein
MAEQISQLSVAADRLGVRGVIEVRQEMSRWDVENRGRAPSPE